MVWVKCHGKKHNLITHKDKNGRLYVMVRKKGGGLKRKYLYKKRKK